MKKKTKIIIGSILAVLMLLVIISLIALTSSKTVVAQIDVEQGSVLVNGKTITETTHLSQEDIIETGADGLATIILYESIVINLESNTKISLDDLTKENPIVSQIAGSAFHQVTNLFGLSSYTVKSGNSVASVRGTEFSIEGDKISVGEGEVDYELDGKQFNVVGGRVVEKVNGEIQERELTQEERERINRLRQRALTGLRELRQKELEKHPVILRTMKRKYDFSNSDIKEAFDLADKGEIDLEEFRDKAPVDLESVEKIIQITKEIKQLNQRDL